MKKWKVFLSIFVLFLAIGAGTIYYMLNFKEYNTIDTEVKKIVDNEYSIKLPEDAGSPNDIGEQSEGENADNKTDELETNNDQSGESSNNNNEKTTGKPSAASIIERYQPSFKDLENQANEKLNTLLSYAFSEYQLKKNNNENISYFYFYRKYNSPAKKLETSTDETFNYVYNALLKDLRKNGYKANEAQPIKDHYNTIKKERRSAIISKARSQLNI